MKSLNQVQLIGHLGGDPEVSESDGKSYARFSIATSEEWLDKKTNVKRENVEWHNLVCFNKLADITKMYLKKGSRVFASGKLKTSKWQDKNNETKYSTQVVIDELIMLDQKPTSEDGEWFN